MQFWLINTRLNNQFRNPNCVESSSIIISITVGNKIIKTIWFNSVSRSRRWLSIVLHLSTTDNAFSIRFDLVVNHPTYIRSMPGVWCHICLTWLTLTRCKVHCSCARQISNLPSTHVTFRNRRIYIYDSWKFLNRINIQTVKLVTLLMEIAPINPATHYAQTAYIPFQNKQFIS